MLIVKPHRHPLVWLIGLAALLYACQDQEEMIPPEAETQDPFVLEAKDFFENRFKPEEENSPNSRKGRNKRQTIRRNLQWASAYVRALSDGSRGVVIPVRFDEELYIKEADSTTSLSNLTYILIYENQRGKKKLEVVTTFPDSAFLASEEEAKRFSGIVYVEDWNGKLLKSIRHMDGKMFLYEPEKDDNSGGRVATVTYCETITDWYTCASSNGGASWSCHYSYTEVTFGICENGGGSSGNYSTGYDYAPATGGNSTDSDDSNGGDSNDNLPQVCDNGYIADYKGNCYCPSNMEEIGNWCLPKCPNGYRRDENNLCVQITDCTTPDPIINAMEDAFTNIWEQSNAANVGIPMNQRLEQGGWIVENNGNYSFVPFGTGVSSSPCGMDGSITSIPNNLVGIVHSHPFYFGEDRRSVCGYNEAEEAYQGGPSVPDYEFLLSIMNAIGDFGLKGYVIDGNFVSSYDFRGASSLQKITRCGY